MIAVIDYHKGNLKSVERGLVAVGLDARITDDLERIRQAKALVLPGVGSFTDAADSMHELGQMELVRERILDGVPFLGICLGEHLLFEGGVEHAANPDEPTEGLGILPGIVHALPKVGVDGTAYKIPHVGWNTARPVCEGLPLFEGLYGDESDAGLAAACNDARCLGFAPKRNGEICDEPASSTDLDEISPAFVGCRIGSDASPRASALGAYFYFTHSYCVPDSDATIATTTHSIEFPSAVQYGDACFGVQFHPEKSSDEGLRLLRNFACICDKA